MTGRALVVIGFALISSQVFATRPWQALIAIGVLLVIFGGLLLADTSEEEPDGTRADR